MGFRIRSVYWEENGFSGSGVEDEIVWTPSSESCTYERTVLLKQWTNDSTQRWKNVGTLSDRSIQFEGMECDRGIQSRGAPGPCDAVGGNKEKCKTRECCRSARGAIYTCADPAGCCPVNVPGSGIFGGTQAEKEAYCYDCCNSVQQSNNGVPLELTSTDSTNIAFGANLWEPEGFPVCGWANRFSNNEDSSVNCRIEWLRGQAEEHFIGLTEFSTTECFSAMEICRGKLDDKFRPFEEDWRNEVAPDPSQSSFPIQCGSVSYASCSEFVGSFDSLYELRNTTAYPGKNPMLLHPYESIPVSSIGNE